MNERNKPSASGGSSSPPGKPDESAGSSGARDQGKAAMLAQLSRVLGVKREVADSAGGSGNARLLAAWQARRLAVTYKDFSAEKRYQQAVKFFLDDLYGPEDFRQRDADLQKVLPIMLRVLPEAALAALSDALELQALTLELDHAMLALLENEFGFAQRLDSQMWSAAYRGCGRREARERQIALTVGAGRKLEQVVRKPMVYSLVLIARGPAMAAGFGALQSFVERGFRAFRSMRGAHSFIDAVEQRETRLMEQLFAGEAPADWQQDPGIMTLADLSGTAKEAD